MSDQRSDEAGNGAKGGRPADPWSAQLDALGAFIRAQRQLANLSLREMANLTSVSNAYLSQIERGLHQPSLKVLRSIAEALNLSTEQLLAQTGWGRANPGNGAGHDSRHGSGRDSAHGSGNGNGYEDGAVPDTEEAIRRDPRLTDAQREALLGVYRGFLDASR